MVAGFRWHKAGPVVGSLLLGLYDDEGRLHHVGVSRVVHRGAPGGAGRGAGAVPRERRRRPPVAGWRRARQPARRRRRDPAAGRLSRWSGKKDLSLVAAAPGAGGRGRLRRAWRATGSGTPRSSSAGGRTATPSSCTYEQLDRPVRFDVESRAGRDAPSEPRPSASGAPVRRRRGGPARAVQHRADAARPGRARRSRVPLTGTVGGAPPRHRGRRRGPADVAGLPRRPQGHLREPAAGRARTTARRCKVPQDWSQRRQGPRHVRHRADPRPLDARSRTGSARCSSTRAARAAPAFDYAVYLLGRTCPPRSCAASTSIGFDPRGVGRSARSSASPTPTWTPASATSPTRSADAAFDESGRAQPAGIGAELRRQVRRRPARCSPPSRPPATWTRIRAAVGDEQAHLPRLLLRHAARRRLRAAVPAATSAPWCSTARSTRPQTPIAGSRRARPWASSGRSTTSPPGARPTPARCPIAPDAAGRGHRRRSTRPGRARCRADGPAGHRRLGLHRGGLVALHRSRLAGPGPGDRRPAEGQRRRSSSSPTRYAERDPHGHYTNLFDANTAVNCADSRRRPDGRAGPRAAGRSGAPKYPLFGGAARGRPADLRGLARQARPVPGRAGRRRAADRGRRHHGDPATPYEQTPSWPTCSASAGAHLGGRGAHRLPEDRAASRRREPLPDRPATCRPPA